MVQLKSIYDVVKAVRGNSGWKWDDEKGADITPDNKGAWDEYVAVHPKAASFRNKGWVHLALFDVLGALPNGLQDLSNRKSEGTRASQGPSVAGSSQFADTQGSEEREDGPQSQSQAGEAPSKGLHVFRASQGPSVAGFSNPAGTQGFEKREDSPPCGPQPQSQAGEAPPKGFHVFRAIQGPSAASSSKPADTQGPEERQDSPPWGPQPQSQAGEAPPKGHHVFRAIQGPSVAGSSKPADSQGPEGEDSPPWVTIESLSRSQVGEENVSNDEGKVSNVSYLLR